MVGLTDVIPNPFGGFAPFPNSIMIPFMGTQSAVLGYDFGLSYEAGKRMIKSMDNEDFNKFIKDGNTVEFEGKQQNLLSVFSKKHYRNMIEEFTTRIPSSLVLQDTIIEASVAIELKKANRTPSAMVEIIQAFGGASLSEIRTQMDSFPIAERALIFIAVPLLAVLYVIAGGTAPSQVFENTGPPEPEPPIPPPPTVEPTSPTPTVAPTEPFIAPEIKPVEYSFSYTYQSITGTKQGYYRGTLEDSKRYVIWLESNISKETGDKQKALISLLYNYRKALHDKYNIWI